MKDRLTPLSVVELCAGAGGQALGLERAGFQHGLAVEIDKDACQTLRMNRPDWQVLQADLNVFSGKEFSGIDLLAGGLPCPPFSKAGKQLGELDERNLFPAGLRLVEEIRPRAVMFENVKGFLDPRFEPYRILIENRLKSLGFSVFTKLMNASQFGVPQLRPRVVVVALRPDAARFFSWPEPSLAPKSVGDTLLPLMSSKGWEGASRWAAQASGIAPTLVGGSKKHGGPDLGPTRARKSWAALGVNGLSIADEAPLPGFEGMPRLTVQMAALIQGFPPEWRFFGRKTTAYRQVGNAFPPPVAEAVGQRIALALHASLPLRAAS